MFDSHLAEKNHNNVRYKGYNKKSYVNIKKYLIELTETAINIWTLSLKLK